MDSDGGMLLNLAVDDTPKTVKKSKPTGGRWKDRLQRKSASVRAEKRANKQQATAANNSPPKKRKRETTNDPNALPKEPTIKKVRSSSGRDKAKDGTETFVSSLFTRDQGEKEEQEDDDNINSKEQSKTFDPSNAPLTDSTSFNGLGINTRVADILKNKMQLIKPTRIQRAVLPRLIQTNKDLFVQAQTGSGKTLSYVLPIVDRLMKVKLQDQVNLDRHSGLFAVILAPTRELSNQIYSVLENLTKGCCHWLVPGIVIGGEKKKSEKARIRKGVNILVATPGRLADHFENTEALDLSRIRWVVLDEGDRLMDLGFEETITSILQTIDERSMLHRDKIQALPDRRVNVLCSATMKGKVERLGEVTLTRENSDWVTPESVPQADETFDNDKDDEETTDILHTAPAQLIQDYSVIPAKLRLVTLASTLLNLSKSKPQSRVMVFFSCSDSVDFHFSSFTNNGVDPQKKKQDDDEGTDNDDSSSTVKTSPLLGSKNTTTIYKLHGSLNQQTRTSTLAAFSNHDTSNGPSILFCTDVASRGLDLPLISNVIEYDPPFAQEDHVHRIGRTARAGHDGSSIIFLLPGKEEKYIDVLKTHHPQGLYQKSHKDIIKTAFGKNWETDATTWHLDIERWLLEDDHALNKARRAFTSHIRAYATHLSSERNIFDMKDIHLGHIAKSFGLRETPGKFKTHTPSAKKGHHSAAATSKTMDPRKKMLSMAHRNLASAANEFNIG